jgi:CheY-like chemotaxis protein
VDLLRNPAHPPYRILLVTDDDELEHALLGLLSRRPVRVCFADPGPAVADLLEEESYTYLAHARSVPWEARQQRPVEGRGEVVSLGNPALGVAQACGELDAALRLAHAHDDPKVVIVGVPRAFRLVVELHVVSSPFLVMVARSREEALDPGVVGSADLVLMDAKLGEIDQWRLAVRMLDRDSGQNLQVLGIVPSIDATLLSQSMEHRMAGFLLRSLIDHRLFYRLEIICSTSPRQRPADVEVDSRFVAPAVPGGHHPTTTVEISEERIQQRMLSISPGVTPIPISDGRAERLLGTSLGKVQLRKVIGQGGNGTVYLGVHGTLDTPVAVKVLFGEDVSRDERFAHRFIDEARIAARIDHPNMVRVIDFDRDDESGCYYLVMELVRGTTLRELVRFRGPLEEREVLRIAELAGDVLALANQYGVVHRDISPANILITDRSIVKIADLGIAKTLRENDPTLPGAEPPAAEPPAAEPLPASGHTNGVETATGLLMGTPAYVSPEQSRDARQVDFRSDIYSLGATLYHAVTGAPPYAASTVAEVIAAHQEAPIPDPRQERPEMSPACGELIRRMLQKDPVDRFRSYDDLLAAVRHCQRQRLAHRFLLEMRQRGWRGRLACRLLEGLHEDTLPT